MVNVEEIVRHRTEKSRLPYPFKRFLVWLMRHLLHEKRLSEFAAKYPSLRGLDCIDQILSFCGFRCEMDISELENIPPYGAALIISNHPIGSLDGLALLKMVSSVRPDAKIVVNRILSYLKPLENLFICIDNMGAKANRRQIKNMQEHLLKGGVLIIFPSGEVSRLSPKGIRDGKWSSGFVRLAARMRASIVPVYMQGKNSFSFYLLSLIYKPASTYTLVHEMFKQQGKLVRIHIGRCIPHENWFNPKESPAKTAKLFKRHIYKIGKGKKGCIKGEKPIALPADRLSLKTALEGCQVLGKTSDDKLILLYRRSENESFSPILHELGRLREISFRAVGEGSGQRLDLDMFDDYYCHIVLWNPKRLEIVGAYRLIPTAEQIRIGGIESLYSSGLFTFMEGMLPILKNGVELGRSFIQPTYWGKRGLDYLWLGIGAYLASTPQCRYLFGPVSISANIPSLARDLLISFYRQYFAPKQPLAVSKNPYPFSPPQVKSFFSGNDSQKDFQRLKSALSNMNTAVPMLYRQYSELCEDGGVLFADFGVDPNFSSCVDGLVVVDTSMLTPSRYQRYIAPNVKG
ncbi:MAG: lysophospholipid acyltransferase family protein [Deferribacteraceae bacterium]|jgi:putative hemolysin|nr:lysophospholipid acyltransferase family protein [Deferribacteraceae bacterium]